jgi:hypothetical protein
VTDPDRLLARYQAREDAVLDAVIFCRRAAFIQLMSIISESSQPLAQAILEIIQASQERRREQG